jgi:epoxyqueuosine reductase QueG
VGNPEAAKPSDTWSGWSSTFAWRERAMAYDDHLARLRREAYERAIEEEAGRQAREVEKARGRANELLALSYDRAMEWLENAQSSDLRFQDVVSVIRLKMDYLKAFPVQPEPSHDDDWTEEDDELAEEIARKIMARRDQEEGAQDPDEEVSESNDSDDDSEGDET